MVKQTLGQIIVINTRVLIFLVLYASMVTLANRSIPLELMVFEYE
jgi:hypothetical protein